MARTFGVKVTTPLLQVNTATPAVVGQVWTATDTVGNGSWQNAGAGSSQWTTNASPAGIYYNANISVGIGTINVANAALAIGGSVASNATQMVGLWVEPTITLSSGNLVSNTIRTQATLSITALAAAGYNAAAIYLDGPTLSGGSGTTTFANPTTGSSGLSRLFIEPLSLVNTVATAANAYGIYVFGPGGNGVTSGYTAFFAAGTGATNNYALGIGAQGTPTTAALTVDGSGNLITSGTISATGNFSAGSVTMTSASDVTPLSLIGFSSQTNPLQVWQNSAGTTLSSVDKDGNYVEPRLTQSEYYISDEFSSGTLTSGTIGNLGWTFTNGAIAWTAAIAGHPGILNRSTSASALTTTTMAFLIPSGPVGSTNLTVMPSEFFDIEWIFRLNTSDTNTVLRFGLIGATPGSAPSTTNNAICIEKAAADTDFFGNCQGASASTRTAAMLGGTISTTTWYHVRIRRVNATTIGFNIKAGGAGAWGTEKTVTTNIPTGALVPFMHIYNNAVAAAKTVDLDFFDMIITAIART